MKPPIFILSDAVQTGKTTLVQQWLSRIPDAAGILTPDENNTRLLIDIASGQRWHLQLKESDEGIRIGRFVFSEQVFAKARELLLRGVHETPSWLIVDEVGKLEVYDGSGLEPAVSNLIDHFKREATTTKLLLLVRDSLLDRVISHYGLEEATLVSRSYFREDPPALTGLLLCGGQSKRMGTDKAFIAYHSMPQYAWAHNLLLPFCDQVILSIKEQQRDQIPDLFCKLADDRRYQESGPLAGLLSAFDRHREKAIFVIGCDYPYLNRKDLLQLIHARETGLDAVCFINEDHFAEPLLAIYEPSCGDSLQRFYTAGGRSLQQFLKQINTKFITAKHPQCLTSVDDREKQEQFNDHARGKQSD